MLSVLRPVFTEVVVPALIEEGETLEVLGTLRPYIKITATKKTAVPIVIH
jgi:hypothetical protein